MCMLHGLHLICASVLDPIEIVHDQVMHDYFLHMS